MNYLIILKKKGEGGAAVGRGKRVEVIQYYECRIQVWIPLCRVIGVFWGFASLSFSVIFNLYKQTSVNEDLSNQRIINSFEAPLAFSENQ